MYNLFGWIQLNFNSHIVKKGKSTGSKASKNHQQQEQRPIIQLLCTAINFTNINKFSHRQNLWCKTMVDKTPMGETDSLTWIVYILFASQMKYRKSKKKKTKKRKKKKKKNGGFDSNELRETRLQHQGQSLIWYYFPYFFVESFSSHALLTYASTLPTPNHLAHHGSPL